MPGLPTTSSPAHRTKTPHGLGPFPSSHPTARHSRPAPLGFGVADLAGPGFGLTLDAQENVWVNSFTGQNITKFDKTGKPLSPPEGWSFNGQISQMQGIIAAPNGDSGLDRKSTRLNSSHLGISYAVF